MGRGYNTGMENTNTLNNAAEPWYVLPGVHPGGGIGIGPVDESGDPHTVVTYNGGDSEERAALIAAAPEMAEALKNIAAGDPNSSDVRAARAALKKAGLA